MSNLDNDHAIADHSLMFERAAEAVAMVHGVCAVAGAGTCRSQTNTQGQLASVQQVPGLGGVFACRGGICKQPHVRAAALDGGITWHGAELDYALASS